MNVESINREAEFVEWKRKCSMLQPGDELDVTNDYDRALEGNILAWAYRQKGKGYFFHKETRGARIFLVRDK
jgi:hypothetical protein